METASGNLTAEEYDRLLLEINDKYADIVLPVVIIIGILMFLGLFGNPIVIYFYGCRSKPTPSYMFIVCLAVFDLITCCVSMPLEIVDLLYFYKFPNAEACRTLRFINYFSSIASGASLIAIAVDRFRKICRPFNDQITVKIAKYVIVGIIAFSLFSSWPSLVFYTVSKVNISDHSSILGEDCRMTIEDSYQKYILAYEAYLLLAFVIVFSVLVILYCNVGKKLYHLRKFEVYATGRRGSTRPSQGSEGTRASTKFSSEDDDDGGFKTATKERNISTSSTEQTNNKGMTSTPFINLHQNEGKIITDTKGNSLEQQTRQTARVSYSQSVKDNENLRDKKKLRAQSINTQRYTVIAIAISFAFVFSYLPYLILTIWSIFIDYDPNFFSNAELVVTELFFRSFLFNSVCNPMIYGLLNSEFKKMVGNVLRRIFCCGKGVQKVEFNQEFTPTSVG